ncbi:hypothetical protein XJ44_07795 [Thermosipho affectus]|uniref:PilZ domain-containing protein n=1 Tax=Thermosipho affectus TaxID=660294 RepID=A0ABX3IG04_9BACT|nr:MULTISPECIES: PilZ domain-containing protein [Thermosipho]ANQ54321.1 hypothetical protein Y592_07940 [Thermosipho sp. 1070]APT72766.1 hypothetical protein BG95_07855 [Thermosipho sp. 1063]ONN26759.1 hypothetical protein XJ44_07795 [Thermosipho affectus]OOC42204.1 hypothetical protein XO08_07970 [Thermosipho sp. 1074]
MTIIEYINKNLSGIYLIVKDSEKREYQVRLIAIKKNGIIEIESIELFTIGKRLLLNIPVKEALLALVGEIIDNEEKRYFLKTDEKIGVIQRRKEKRFPFFKRGKCNNEKLVIVDVSKSGLQFFSENDLELEKEVEILIDEYKIKITPIWKIFEEEIYRIGGKVSKESINNWQTIIKNNERV